MPTLHAGASSAAVVKHLEVQGYALAELALRRSSQSSSGLRCNQQTVAADISGQVGGVTGIPGQKVEAPAHSDLRGGVTGLSSCLVMSTPWPLSFISIEADQHSWNDA